MGVVRYVYQGVYMMAQKRSKITKNLYGFTPFVALLTALLLLLSACGSTNIATTSPGSVSVPSSTATPDAAATLTIYATLTQSEGQKLAQAFESYASGITVNVVTGGTGTLMQRIAAERQIGGVKADVIMLSDPSSMDFLAQQKVLSIYKPANESLLAPAFVGTDWAGAFSINDVIIYHKGMTLPVPQQWKDLTSSAYRGQVEFSNPSSSDAALALAGYLLQRSGSYFSSLQKNGAVDLPSGTQVDTDVATGKVAVGISSDELARDLIATGAALKIVWPRDGAIPVPVPVSIVAGHESLLSEKFINWLFSNAGQQTVAALGYTPALSASQQLAITPTTTATSTVTSIATGTTTDKLANVNINQILSQRSAILAQFRAIFPS